MIFIARFSGPSVITYFGIIVGVLGIYLASSDINWSIACLFICAICDFFDGKFARLFRRNEQEKKFGIMIDSLADTLMFAALPSVILFSLYPSMASLVVGCVYALCGITRLAVFTSEAEPNKKLTHYRGLPITSAGFIIPVIYVMLTIFSWPAAEAVLYVTYAALSLLFILNIKVRKP
ncbi:MAG: CDP-alcohol phosphatidyltransferase family protein [Candidatus Nomurabacteria bacterium]|jgi:CDP-diacylglycerol--serine O-phosphatidyltransferase|nr:CDP-alcohol phosphatidyltransferase family protein [Candidatus Nomurabacteria bacterium]